MSNYQIVSASTMQDVCKTIILYSTQGAGKTTAIGDVADCEEGAPLLVLDMEAGTSVLNHKPDIDIISIKDINDSQGKPGFGWGNFMEVLDDLVAGKISYRDTGQRHKTVAWDNVSESVDQCVQWVIRTITRNIAEKDRPDQNDWGKVVIEILKATRRLRDYGRNTGTNILIAGWEIPHQNDMGQVIKNGLLASPSLARKLPGIVDAVGYMTVTAPNVRRITFESSLRTDAKFRRSEADVKQGIPLMVEWEGRKAKPLCDILGTLRSGKPFPRENYRTVSM